MLWLWAACFVATQTLRFSGLKSDRRRADKALLVAANEVPQQNIGQGARLQMVADTSTPPLTGFITANGETRSPHVIDGGKAYTPLPMHGLSLSLQDPS
jgi:hypothetical protein